MISRETQANWYRPLFFIGASLLIIKAFSFSEPLHIELNKHAIEEEYYKYSDARAERDRERLADERQERFEQRMREDCDKHERIRQQIGEIMKDSIGMQKEIDEWRSR